MSTDKITDENGAGIITIPDTTALKDCTIETTSADQQNEVTIPDGYKLESVTESLSDGKLQHVIVASDSEGQKIESSVSAAEALKIIHTDGSITTFSEAEKVQTDKPLWTREGGATEEATGKADKPLWTREGGATEEATGKADKPLWTREGGATEEAKNRKPSELPREIDDGPNRAVFERN